MLCKFALAVAFLAVFSITPCCSVIEEHLIEKLPGWRGPLPSQQYSGYIKLDPVSGKEFFYWFVFSENDPINDPLVLWLNGGPGCSSLYGFFQENGPIRLNLESARNITTPIFNKNPYGWAKIANMLYLESPTGAGYSYSTDNEDYTMDDDQTAHDNFDFLLNFFDFYSEFKQNDFYITGESYAGIYIPMLAETIQFMNDYLPSSRRINLKGLMIGNGCIGNEVGGCGTISGIGIESKFYHAHALVSDILYHQITDKCDFTKSSLSVDCVELVDQMTADIGNINIYDIYDTCPSSLSMGSDPSYHADMARDPMKALLTLSPKHRDSKKEYSGPLSCIDELAIDYYLNDDRVRTAIHAKSVEEIGKWTVCSTKMTYIANVASLFDVYRTLAAKYRIVIYNGDVDACVPFVGAQQWTSSLRFPKKEKWRPWWVDNKIAGYVTTYDRNDFTFITVKGSGHMVPHYKPKQAYAMFERYLNKERF